MSEDAIAKVITSLNKHYAKPVAMVASEIPEIRRLRTGIFPVVDFVMGGGCPINRITEFYGAYSSGKSLLAQILLAEGQKYDWKNNIQGGISKVEYKRKNLKTKLEKDEFISQDYFEVVDWKSTKKDAVHKRSVLIDYEHTFDPVWGKRWGLDLDGLLVIVPETGAQMVDMVSELLTSPDIGVMVIDSIAAAGSDLELEASAEDEQMSVNARFWNKAMRKFQSAMNSNPENDITLIVINRAYAKVGSMYAGEETSSGSGLKFGKSVSVRLTPLSPIRSKVEGEGEIEVGRNIKVKCMKNKTAAPFKEGEFYISLVDDGVLKAGDIDILSQLISLGVKTDVIVRSGAFYTYKGKKVQGREKFVSAIIENKWQKEIEDAIFAEL